MILFINITTEDGELLVRDSVEVDTSYRPPAAQNAYNSREILSIAEEAVQIVLARADKNRESS